LDALVAEAEVGEGKNVIAGEKSLDRRVE